MPKGTSLTTLRPAIFLDRDGTLNEDSGYLYEIKAWRWLPGAVEALAMFAKKGYALVVITNQSGIARGYYTVQHMHDLHAWVNAELAQHHLCIDAFYHCPHHPNITGPCSCRKPSPHLLLQAAKDLQLDVSRSYMIGDKISDAEAGAAAGCASYLISASCDTAQNTPLSFLSAQAPMGRVSSLLEAAHSICCS